MTALTPSQQIGLHVHEAKDGFAKYAFSVDDETDGKRHPGFDISEREDEEQAGEGDSNATPFIVLAEASESTA